MLAIPGVLMIFAASPAWGSCTATREYVTTLEYLRDRKELAIPEADARKVAQETAKGCSGAARRMIRVSSMLSKAGFGSKDSLENGLAFAKSTDEATDTFVTIFQRAFLPEHLDLDLQASLSMAQSLTRGFEGDTVAVRKDFEKLVDFCASSKNLDLPKPQCGVFAARVAKLGQEWKGGIYPGFVKVFDFARSEKGVQVPTGQALKIAEKIVAAGPDSPENFISAYRYAVSKRGLGMNEKAALDFATEMGAASNAAEKKSEVKGS
jgi:hypothetical protein